MRAAIGTHEMPIFVPCPACARHVATTENSCPFCASAVPDDLASRAVPAASRRMNRFAMLTFATTITAGAAIVACSSDQGTSVPFYGSSCTDDDCGYVNSGPSYGLPGNSDSGSLEDASPFDAGDATVVDGSGDAGEDAD